MCGGGSDNQASPYKRRHSSNDVCHGRWMNSRPLKGMAYKPTYIEDVANVITHAFFVVPGIIMGLNLYTSSTSIQHTIVSIQYTLALLTLFTCSSLHHASSLVGFTGSALGYCAHLGDRVAIYIFIAASYTPWLVLRSYHIDTQFVLYLIWSAAIAGLVYQIAFHERFHNVEVVIYITLGLGPSIVVLSSICFNGWVELAIGGATYIGGVLFYKLDGIIPFAHAVWHLFVIAGALIHYYAIYTNLFLQPQPCNTEKPYILDKFGLF